ncbi:hypothetical protein [Kitasatospora sp. NPDC088351]|uniref:hypothetical protein n=1 Tax=Kitasatospora sp. NPDC088351 TaxID=3155180 RepID=UPI0034463867
MSRPRRYRVVLTDAAREQLRALDGAERLAGIPSSALDREALHALLAGTSVGDLLVGLDDLAADPYGGPSLARTYAVEDDRVALLGVLAVTYMVSPDTEPPVITVTGLRMPKGH